MPDPQATSSDTTKPADAAVKLSCRHLWKVFGDDVESLFSAGVAVDAATLEQAGYITAVRDASFDVYEGEIFVIMGLSG